MDKKEAYLSDILPEIGDYVLKRESPSFGSSEIAEGLSRYSSQEIEEVLEYIAEMEDIRHIEKEDGEWRFLAFKADTWEQVDRELENDGSELAQTQLPDVREKLKQLSAQEYGKLRNNMAEVYQGLKVIRDEKKSRFKTSDLRERVDNVRASEIGVVLSGLAAAGLISHYREDKAYDLDSVDTDKIRDFKQAVENVESFEEFKILIEGED
jgi:hypothetical protein